jgi:hypothetical protein
VKVFSLCIQQHFCNGPPAGAAAAFNLQLERKLFMQTAKENQIVPCREHGKLRCRRCARERAMERKMSKPIPVTPEVARYLEGRPLLEKLGIVEARHAG